FVYGPLAGDPGDGRLRSRSYVVGGQGRRQARSQFLDWVGRLPKWQSPKAVNPSGPANSRQGLGTPRKPPGRPQEPSEGRREGSGPPSGPGTILGRPCTPPDSCTPRR